MDRRKAQREPVLPQGTGSDSMLNVLFLAIFPLVLWLFQGSAVLVVTAVVEMILLALALRLISSGEAAAQDYAKAPVACAPRIPRKLIGSGLIGIVVMVLAGHHFASFVVPLLVGLAAAALSVAAFGLDPLRDKGTDDPEIAARLEAETMLSALEDRLAAATHRIAGLGDADLARRTQAAQDMVLSLVRALGTSPAQIKRLLRPATKFTELLGAEVERLEAHWEGEQYLFSRRRYVAKLDAMTESFETHLRKGGKAGQDAYDREADILLERMRHESAA